MAWRDGPFHRRERLAIVHHPSGDPLSVSNDRLCFVATPKLTGRGPKESLSDFGHMCDADNGSSGGMVISDEAGCHQIIGLHHWGVGGEYKSGLQNQAVSIDAIYRDLQNKAKSREQQITKKLQENAQAVLSAVRLAKCTDLLAWRDNKTVTEE
jgi:hypothetical protein